MSSAFESYRQPNGAFDFREISLAEAQFEDMDCRGANFSQAFLTNNGYERAVFEQLDLTGASFNKAHLEAAIFENCKLLRADFSWAYLDSVQFINCDLSHANFYRADARAADITSSKLDDTLFTGMDTESVVFSNSDLSEANFLEIKTSLYSVLEKAEDAIPSIMTALKSGEFSGVDYQSSRWTDGNGVCLIGHIARHRGVSCWKLEGIEPNGNSPIERWLMSIQNGDTPETNPVSQQLLNWMRLYLLERGETVNLT